MKQKNSERCPICGTQLLLNNRRLINREWDGHEVMLEIHADVCPLCGEAFLSPEAIDELEKQFKEFKGANPPAFPKYVKKVRELLKLSQEEADKILTGGIGTFQRYELGLVSPPLSVINLLKMLEKHPEHINILKSSE